MSKPAPARRLRVLVVDDSPLFADSLAHVLEADGDIEVVARAGNGRDAVERVAALYPQLVAMDIHMPLMDGLEAVERIMSSRPTPILLLTSDSAHHGARGTFEALSRGALDLVPKQLLGEGEVRRAWLRDHVRLLASVPVIYRPRLGRAQAATTAFPAPAISRSGGVGIVASTGGPPVISHILSALPRDFPLPILVVQHLAPGFTAHLASWLAGSSSLPVRVASPGLPLEGGVVYVGPDDAHMTVQRGRRLVVDSARPRVNGHRPSGTLLLASLAAQWGARAVGVVLTGMGSDGAVGLRDIHSAGGMTIAQDEATSAVFGMPRAARDLGAVRRLLPISAIAEAICQAAAAVVQSGSTPGGAG